MIDPDWLSLDDEAGIEAYIAEVVTRGVAEALRVADALVTKRDDLARQRFKLRVSNLIDAVCRKAIEEARAQHKLADVTPHSVH